MFAEKKMFDDFMIRALLGGIGVAIAAGPLGSFVVWKRMAFFGDALSHSALLGVAMGFVIGLNPSVGIIVLSVLFSLLIVALQEQRSYSSDTLLGIMAHSTLAIGLVVISFFKDLRVDLVSFLFGDILAATNNDLYIIYGGLVVSLGVLYFLWKPLLLSTLSQDLAKVEGVNIYLVRTVFMLLLSLFVALSIKVVGVLLITSMLVIPAATARAFSKTPEKMEVIESLVGVVSVI